jgi:Putative transposase of IS4/5 family (DUF4096)
MSASLVSSSASSAGLASPSPLSRLARFGPLLLGSEMVPLAAVLSLRLWNAVFYQAKNGGTWRALPHDFPPWAAVWQQKTGPPREARVAC